MILGRVLFSLVTERQVHDVYSFAVGVYAISGMWYLQEWLLSIGRSISASGQQQTGELEKILAKFVTYGVRFTYYTMVFAFIFPLGLGLLMEIFVIGPLKATLYGDTGIIFAFVSAFTLSILT